NMLFDQLPPSYRWELQKYRHGPGVFKVDWALSSPIPWKSRDCLQAATVHIGGTADEDLGKENSVGGGRRADSAEELLSRRELIRSNTRAEWSTHGLGILSCAEQFQDGYDGAHRIAGRTFRARIS